MKKQIRKAMLCTIAMMVAAILTLTGVTYAWFSESDSADVTGLDFTVFQSEGGVYISNNGYDPESFTTSIALSAGGTGVVYQPASTAGDYNNGKLQFFKGTLEGPNDATVKIEEISPDAKTGYYIEQDIYFDNSTGGSSIYIALANDTAETTITPTGEGATKNIHYATRVAIVTRGSVLAKDLFPTDEDKEAEGFVQGDYSNTPVSLQIYENNSTTHTQTGIREYTKIDSEAGSSGTYKYFGLKAATSADQNNAGGVSRFPSDSNANFQLMATKTDPKQVVIEVPAYSYLKTTVYVWIEGQDADCQNDVSGQPFSANIKFCLAPAPTVVE